MDELIKVGKSIWTQSTKTYSHSTSTKKEGTFMMNILSIFVDFVTPVLEQTSFDVEKMPFIITVPQERNILVVTSVLLKRNYIIYQDLIEFTWNGQNKGFVFLSIGAKKSRGRSKNDVTLMKTDLAKLNKQTSLTDGSV